MDQDEPDMSYLQTLNPAQRLAVTYPKDNPLQILAGPGSGKTRVLTARVAYLVHYWGLRPWEITAVTFTNKAAQEMRKRLNMLLGPGIASRLILGTFHATCAGYLRKHGRVIGLPNNFAIMDAEDAKKIISGLLKPMTADLKSRYISLKDGQVMSEISKAKAQEESPEKLRARAAALGSKGEILSIIAEIYQKYEETLRAADSLDFDDLLVFGLKLFRAAPKILDDCKHILVDEFQDTNTTQYELMKLFSKAHGCVTVVGDPDQSIYGWRSANIENLEHMKRDFPDTDAVHLEENYRSTGAILAASLAVVSQDKKRAAKGLFTSHGKGYPVTLKSLPSAFVEAAYIAEEVKRLIAHSGNMLGHEDFAVLLRYNALSRPIETAFQREQIPCRLIGGHKFFERVEVKDLLAYLQLVDNPNYYPAFARVVNVPKRAIGEKSVEDIQEQAGKQGVTSMELCERIVDGEMVAGVKTGLKKNLAPFVKTVRELRVHAKKGTDVSELIKSLIEKIGYEEHLRKTQPDFDSRWENVQELISYAVIVSEEQSSALQLPEVELEGFVSAKTVINVDDGTVEEDVKPVIHPIFRRSVSGSSNEANTTKPDIKPVMMKRAKSRPAVDEPADIALNMEYDEEDEEFVLLDSIDKLPASDGLPNGVEARQTPLRTFLEASSLSTDTESKDDDKNTPKVTISTVHGAKGLEWPVVFLPCLEDGTYPFYRSVEEDEIREERRLLYVAMTRAQAALVLTHAKSRMQGGQEQDRTLSPFIVDAHRQTPVMFTSTAPDVSASDRELFATLLGRPSVSAGDAAIAVQVYRDNAKPLPQHVGGRRGGTDQMFWFNSHKKESRATEYWSSEKDEYALPPMERGAAQKALAVPTEERFEPQGTGFISARTRLLDKVAERLGDDPKFTTPTASTDRPISHRSSSAQGSSLRARMEYDENISLDFGSGGDMTAAGASSKTDFGKANKQSLNAMKNIGLPPPVSTLWKEQATGGPSVTVNNFQSASSSSLAMMKSLGMPEPASEPVRKAGSGNKRLGVGRPMAPWGSKKAKND